MIFVIDQTVSRAPRQGSLSCCRKVVCTRRLQRTEPGHLRWACHASRADCEAPIRRLGRSRSRVAVTLRHNSSLLPACWIRRSARRSEQEAGPPKGAAVSPEPGRRESRGGRSLPRRFAVCGGRPQTAGTCSSVRGRFSPVAPRGILSARIRPQDSRTTLGGRGVREKGEPVRRAGCPAGHRGPEQ